MKLLKELFFPMPLPLKISQTDRPDANSRKTSYCIRSLVNCLQRCSWDPDFCKNEDEGRIGSRDERAPHYNSFWPALIFQTRSKDLHELESNSQTSMNQSVPRREWYHKTFIPKKNLSILKSVSKIFNTIPIVNSYKTERHNKALKLCSTESICAQARTISQFF